MDKHSASVAIQDLHYESIKIYKDYVYNRRPIITGFLILQQFINNT